jgi:hypothetical protein
MASFTIKRGDTSPILEYTLSPATDCTGSTAVFSMARVSGANVINRAAATIASPATAGVLRYQFTAGNTANSGVFLGEFEVTHADGSIETFPNNEHLTIAIHDDLG